MPSMRRLLLFSLFSVLIPLPQTAAAPLDTTIPVLGQTFELIGPSSVPNPKTPVSAPEPTRQLNPRTTNTLHPENVDTSSRHTAPPHVARSEHYPDIRPRLIRNADYGVSPNTTIDQPALTTTEMEKRAVHARTAGRTEGRRPTHVTSGRTKDRKPSRTASGRPQDRQASHNTAQQNTAGSGLLPGLSTPAGLSPAPSEDSSREATSPAGAQERPAAKRPEHPSSPAREKETSPSAQSAGSPYSAASSGIRTVGSTSQAGGDIANSLPLGSLSPTPVTSPDTGPSPGKEDSGVPAKAKSEVPPTVPSSVPDEKTAENDVANAEDESKTIEPSAMRRSLSAAVLYFVREMDDTKLNQPAHSLVLDTDSVANTRPDADAKMGFVNLDSNRKPQSDGNGVENPASEPLRTADRNSKKEPAPKSGPAAANKMEVPNSTSTTDASTPIKNMAT